MVQRWLEKPLAPIHLLQSATALKWLLQFYKHDTIRNQVLGFYLGSFLLLFSRPRFAILRLFL